MDSNVAELENLFKQDIKKHKKGSKQVLVSLKQQDWYKKASAYTFAEPQIQTPSLFAPFSVRHEKNCRKPSRANLSQSVSIFHVTNISMMRAEMKTKIELYAHDLKPQELHDDDLAPSFQQIIMSNR